MRDDHGTAGYNPALEPLLTVSGTCDVLRVSRQTVYRLVRRGELHPDERECLSSHLSSREWGLAQTGRYQEPT